MWYLKKKEKSGFSWFYLCVPASQMDVNLGALILVRFQQGQKGCGEVAAGFIPDNVLQISFVLWWMQKDDKLYVTRDDNSGCSSTVLPTM